MLFEKRVKEIKKVLFAEYEISSKVNIEDWVDEANEMDLLISITSDEIATTSAYNDYLVEKFVDDEYTDFNVIANKIALAVLN